MKRSSFPVVLDVEMNEAKLSVRPVCPHCGDTTPLRFEAPEGERHLVCSSCSEAYVVTIETSGDLAVATARELGRFVSL